jgi:hypothetical protein
VVASCGRCAGREEGAVGRAFEGGDGLLAVGQIQVLQLLPSVTARRVVAGPCGPQQQDVGQALEYLEID